MAETLGRKLAEARASLGLSIEDVARQTRIHRDVVARVEADDFASFPHPIYLKIFVRMYAKFLRIDVSTELARLEPAHSVPVRPNPDRCLPPPDVGRYHRREWSPRRWRLYPLLLGVAAIFLISVTIRLMVDLPRLRVVHEPLPPAPQTAGAAETAGPVGVPGDPPAPQPPSEEIAGHGHPTPMPAFEPGPEPGYVPQQAAAASPTPAGADAPAPSNVPAPGGDAAAGSAGTPPVPGDPPPVASPSGGGPEIRRALPAPRRAEDEGATREMVEAARRT